MWLVFFSTALVAATAFDWLDGDGQDDDDNQNDDAQIEDEDSQPEDEEDSQPENETGQVLGYDGSDLLEGTEGDDTLPAGQDEGLAPDEINLLGGDDTAIIDVNDAMTVSGGDGDDSITAMGVLNDVNGGAGNDTLTGDDSNGLSGEAGNDVINFNHGSYDQGEWGGARGGEGDDTITVRADAIVPDYLIYDVGGVGVSGGSGADEINVIYEHTASFDGGEGVIIGTGSDTNYDGRFVRLNDFDPNEDSLRIEVEWDSTTAERDVSVELDQTEEDGTYMSLITLTFEETDDLQEATSTLRVTSATPFTLDDIELVGV